MSDCFICDEAGREPVTIADGDTHPCLMRCDHKIAGGERCYTVRAVIAWKVDGGAMSRASVCANQHTHTGRPA